MPATFLIGYLFLRLTIAAFVIFCRLFVLLFIAPIVHLSRAEKKFITGSGGTWPRLLALVGLTKSEPGEFKFAEPKASKQAPKLVIDNDRERSRDEQACALAMRQLCGYSSKLSESVAKEAVDQLGPKAGLDALVKYCLQQADTPRAATRN